MAYKGFFFVMIKANAVIMPKGAELINDEYGRRAKSQTCVLYVLGSNLGQAIEYSMTFSRFS
jgi:hypothetical protein